MKTTEKRPELVGEGKKRENPLSFKEIDNPREENLLDTLGGLIGKKRRKLNKMGKGT